MVDKKKRVGIVTYHKSKNYGAVLQCYAMQQTLIELGYDVKVIDYTPLFRDPFAQAPTLRGIRNKFTHALKILLHPFRRKRLNIFNDFTQKYLNLTEPCRKGELPQDFDVYIFGSDQLWRCNFKGVYLEKVYFGEFKRDSNSRLCGYAISGDEKSIRSIVPKELTKYAHNFDVLSFREESFSRLVKDITGVDSRVDIDPTLLAKSSIYDPLINEKWGSRRYVLLYELRGKKRGEKSPVRLRAEEIAQELGCEIIELKASTYSIFEFISLFKYAQYIVTSSFHGTAFGLVFQKGMCVVKLNDGHDARYVDLLNSVGAQSMLVDRDEVAQVKRFDYKCINEKLSQARDYSTNYLKSL